jgi:hypothetical protein
MSLKLFAAFVTLHQMLEWREITLDFVLPRTMLQLVSHRLMSIRIGVTKREAVCLRWRAGGICSGIDLVSIMGEMARIFDYCVCQSATSNSEMALVHMKNILDKYNQEKKTRTSASI